MKSFTVSLIASLAVTATNAVNIEGYYNTGPDFSDIQCEAPAQCGVDAYGNEQYCGDGKACYTSSTGF